MKNPIKEDPAVTPSNLDDTRRVVAGTSVLGTSVGQNSPGVIECKSLKQKILPSHDTRRVVVSSGAYCATAGRDPPSVRDSVRNKGQRRFRLDDTRRVVASSGTNGAAAGQNPPGVKDSRINQTRYHQDDIRRFVVADGAKCTEDGQKSLNAKKKQDDEFSALVESLNSGPPDDVLSTHTINMRRTDYRRLTGRNELNDKIVDEYLTLIKERNQREGLQSVYTFPCYIFPHLLGNFDNFEYIESKIKVG